MKDVVENRSQLSIKIKRTFAQYEVPHTYLLISFPLYCCSSYLAAGTWLLCFVMLCQCLHTITCKSSGWWSRQRMLTPLLRIIFIACLIQASNLRFTSIVSLNVQHHEISISNEHCIIRCCQCSVGVYLSYYITKQFSWFFSRLWWWV